jgi:hypothetical protein
MAFGWAAQIGSLVMVFTTRATGAGHYQLPLVVFKLAILTAFIAGALQLRPQFHNTWHVMFRPLNAGFLEIVIGVALAGAFSVLDVGLSMTQSTNMSMTVAQNAPIPMGAIAGLGWVLCGDGCRIVAKNYLRQLNDRPPLQRSPRSLIVTVLWVTFVLALITVAVLGLVWFVLIAFIGFDSSTTPVIGIAGGLIIFVSVVLASSIVVLAGAIGMFRLWRSVDRVLKINRRLAAGL